jgi:TolB-like protein/Flp pilus assembly protein TadD
MIDPEIHRIFDEAVALPALQRAAFLVEACRGDAGLRHEIERLLAALDSAGSVFGTLRSFEPIDADRTPSAPPASPPGARLGPYEIRGLLGAGGMGEVYRAFDPRLGREVAIKVLPAAVTPNVEQLRRFEQEARAAAALNHPNILAIHDVGTHDGRPFVVAELLEGETVRDHIARGPISPKEVVVYGRQIAQGLAAAHAKGIVHRDLKPENLFITTDGRVKILDFGIAKLSQVHLEGGPVSTTTTEAGMLVGTVGYMAPEQVRLQAVDHRADLFALGTVLYEMLSGTRAFRGATPADTLSAVLTREPAPLDPAIVGCGALESIVRRCLEKVPPDRFQSASDLEFAMDTVWAATGSGPRGIVAQRSPLVTVGRLVAALLIIGLLGLWFVVRAGRNGEVRASREGPRVIAVLPFKNISADATQAYFSAGMTEEIRSQLSKISAFRLLSASAVDKYSSGDTRRMAKELGVGSIVEGSVRADQQRVRIDVRLVDARTAETRWADQYNRDIEDVFAVQSDVALRIANALETNLPAAERQRIEHRPTNNVQAYRLYLRSQEFSRFARNENHRGIELLREAMALDPGFAKAQASLAYRLLLLGTYEDSAYTKSALDAAQQAVRADPSLPDGHFVLGTIFAENGKVADARVSFLRALNLDSNHTGSMMNLSIMELELGHYDESFLWATRAFQLSPANSDAYYHVAAPLVFLGDDPVAARWLRDAEQRFPSSRRIQIVSAMLEGLRGRGHAAVTLARNAATFDPNYEEARALLTELTYLTRAPDAETLAEALVQTSPPTSLINAWLVPESPRTRYAYLLGARGDKRQSANLAQAARESAQEALRSGNQSPRVPMDIAATYALLGDLETAMAWAERGYTAGWRDYRTLTYDPAFQAMAGSQQFQTLLTRMQSDVASMRRRANVDQTLPVLPPVPGA